ncbi:MAG: phosphatase PAP2 family protein [Bdellovibrionota bacterium]
MLDFLTQLDHLILYQINSAFTHSILDVFFLGITDLHKTLSFKVITIPLFAFLFIKKYKREGVSLFLILFLALGVNDFIGGKVKKVVSRPRPEFNSDIKINKRSDAGSYSFYSNHSANMFTFATYTSQFIPQLKIPLNVVASLVAYSRVYNGVHYPSDIFTGSIIGYAWGLLFSNLAKKLLSIIKKRKPEK